MTMRFNPNICQHLCIEPLGYSLQGSPALWLGWHILGRKFTIHQFGVVSDFDLYVQSYLFDGVSRLHQFGWQNNKICKCMTLPVTVKTLQYEGIVRKYKHWHRKRWWPLINFIKWSNGWMIHLVRHTQKYWSWNNNKRDFETTAPRRNRVARFY